MSDLITEMNELAVRTAQEDRALRTLINNNKPSLAALGTDAKNSLVDAINEVAAAIHPATPQTLIRHNTSTVYNAAIGYNAILTLNSASSGLSAITNAPAGSSGTLWVVQDGTGGRNLTLHSSQNDVLNTAGVITDMAPNTVAIIDWRTRNGTDFDFIITFASGTVAANKAQILTDLDVPTLVTTAAITGGAGSESRITMKSTSGTGTVGSIAHQWLGGTNGGTVIATALNNGNVGIGTTAPTALAQIGELAETLPATYTGTLKITGPARSSLQGVGGIEMPAAGDGYSVKIQAIADSGAVLAFGKRYGTATWTETMRIDATGNLGIGTTAPASKLNIVSTGSDSTALIVEDNARKIKIGRDSILVTTLVDAASTLYLNGNSVVYLPIVSIDSTLGVTGAATITGLLTANGGLAGVPQVLNGPGGVDVVTLSTKLTTTGTGDALTLADGTNGQIKVIVYAAEGAGGDTAVLTPTTKTGFATVTFTAVGNAVTLQFFTTLGWMVVSNYGCTIG